MSTPLNAEVLRHEAALRGWSASDLAKEAGLSDATVSSALAGKPISAASLKLMATALKRAPVDEVIERLLGRGVLPPRGDQPPPTPGKT